jgi:ABC-type nitrate/sulfonate/bicarbonate transport system permease component
MNRSVFKSLLFELLRMGLALLGFLILWEGISSLNLYHTVFFPPPTVIVKAFYSMIQSGELLSDILVSLQRALIGFFVGSLFGAIVGVLTGRLRFFDYTIGQLARGFRPIPTIALVPLAIVWFGLGELSKYILVIWGVFFPVWINTHLGASQVERSMIWAAKSLGADKYKMLYEIILPSSLPFVIAGMRTGMATAFFVLVAAEMTGAFGGIGYRVFASHLVFRVDKMMVAIAMLGIIGALTDLLFATIIKAISLQQEDR